MAKVLAVVCLSLSVLAWAGFLGFTAGAVHVKQKVFRNCLHANISPLVCLQYMEIIEGTK
jgi:hypothetical protein